MKKLATRFITIIATLIILGCSAEFPNSQYGIPAPKLSTAVPHTLRILVVGGTSGVGRQTVELALARGHHVTAMARRPERLELEHAHLKTIAGDILNTDDTQRAVAGQDVVVIAIGMGLTRDPVSLFSTGTKNILAAMKNANVRRLVAVTGIGAGETRDHGGFFYDNLLWPLGLKTVYEDKERQEALIRDAGNTAIDWTVIRPGFLTDDDARQKYRVLSTMEGVTAGDIPRADVAHFIMAISESDLFLGETPFISE